MKGVFGGAFRVAGAIGRDPTGRMRKDNYSDGKTPHDNLFSILESPHHRPRPMVMMLGCQDTRMQPVGPLRHVGLVGPVRLAGHVGPVRPLGPVRPVERLGPVRPAGPAGPVGLAGPVGRVGPAGPVRPVEPVGAVAPVGPAGPVGPVGPVRPVRLARPVRPGDLCDLWGLADLWANRDLWTSGNCRACVAATASMGASSDGRIPKPFEQPHGEGAPA